MGNYCFFSAQYFPHLGGVERYTYYVAKKLVEGGDEVTIVTSYIKGQPEYEENEGIKIYRVPCFSFMKGRFPVIKLNRKLNVIRKKLEKNKYALIIVNTRFYPHSLYGMWFAKRRRIKCITIEHGTKHLTFNNKYLDILEHIYEHSITFIDKRYCKNYYGVSQACCEWSGHFGIKSMGTLYNAVDINEIEMLMKGEAIDYRKEYGVESNDIVISYTGRILKEKGIPQLLEVIAKIKCKSRIVLFLAGDGPLDHYVQSVAEECNNGNRIIPLGRVDFQHVVALLKETDIFCLPSDSEGFSTSVMEAVAAKCFIITTSCGGTKELIESDEYGILMHDNNAGTLERAIQKALSDESYRQEAATKAYERLKKEFTFDMTVQKIREIAEKG